MPDHSQTSARAVRVMLASLFCYAALVASSPAAQAVDGATPKRVIAVGGAVTEILYALGLEDRIVGVDSTSLYPVDALKTKSNVGYMRQLSPEGVLSLNPDLILAIEGSGPPTALAVLREARIPYVTVPERFTENGLIDKIKVIATQMHVAKRGECLVGAVRRDLDAMREMRARAAGKKIRIMFVMSLVDGRAMAAGRNTAADEIIALAGGSNAIEGYDGYKMIGEEAIVAAKPDFILAMERGKDSLDAGAVFAHPAFKLTPAADRKAFVSMDGLYLLGFGPRTAAAAHDLASTLNPTIAAGTKDWKSSVLAADCRTQ